MTQPEAELDGIADMFRTLAAIDYHGVSPLYEWLALEAAEDPEVLALLLPAAPRARLPHLLFAAVQYLLFAEGSDPLQAFPGHEPYGAFRAWCLDRREALEAVVATRVVQTNEVARCAGSLPCLAAVAEVEQRPLAVLEVGASAGLNLLFDRYRYVYRDSDGGGYQVGDRAAEVIIRPRLENGPGPVLAMPEVAWRRGLDRSPVDITDDDEVRWLEACIWPEQDARRALLDRAAAAARQDPPTVVQGDALEALPALVREVPADVALCIVHTAVLVYLPQPSRFGELLEELAAERPLWWVSGEPAGLVAPLTEQLTPALERRRLGFFYGVVPVGMRQQTPRLLAEAGPHGTWLRWL